MDWDESSFEQHLAALQQQVPDMPIGRLLASSSSLAGMLLSCHDVSQLSGSVVRHGGYLLIAPHFMHISVQEELELSSVVGGESLSSSNDRQSMLRFNVYGSPKHARGEAHTTGFLNYCDDKDIMLLMRLDARPDSEVDLMPVAVLPPR
jgi:hypothetical protein